MKKKIALAMAAAMTVSALALNVSADEYTKVNLLVEGQAVETDQPAVIVDSRTMVPVRVIAETLGCEVDWDAETKTVTFTQGELTASMVVGEKVLNISDGTITYPVEIDTPAVIINNRTMVPVRFLSDTFGFDVDWDAVTKTVNVTAGEDVADDTASGSAVATETTTEATTEETTDSEESTEETTEAATDEDGASEETTAEAADSKAELKAYAEAVDAGVAVLNTVSGGFNDDEQAEFDTQCDALATVLKEVSSDMTDEEIEAANEAVDKAVESFKTLAKAYSVDSDFAEALGEYAE